MRLVDNLGGIESYYLIISGNGTFPENIIFKNLCKKFNGHDKAIFFLNTPIKRKTGLAALNAVPLYPQKFKINSIIFILDGEHFKKDPKMEIQKHLESIGIGITNLIHLQGTFLIKCKSGPHDIDLYCIILGPEVFIEEEVAKLIEITLGDKIDLSNKKEPAGRKSIKNQIKRILRERRKKIEDLIKNTDKKTLEKTFPNICAVLKNIEEEQ